MMCLDLRFFLGTKCEKKPWAIYKWVILSKLSRFELFELNTSSYRVFDGLSENQKIIEIEQTKLKL